MYPRTLTPKLPKGFAFEIPDHVLASQWAIRHGLSLVVDLEYGKGFDDYEEVLALLEGSPTGRLWCVIWRQSECVVVQPVLGRASRHGCVSDALAALARRRR